MKKCRCVRIVKNPLVRTKLGLIRGQLILDSAKRKCYCFTMIPYAKPPINELRFKAPEPAEPWQGILDATKDPPQCYHRSRILDIDRGGSEDCLYLNVYTPDIPSDPYVKPFCRFPVIVFIHGGFFTSGYGGYSEYGPEYLLTQNVVVVTMNYRFGLLGFISFEDKSLGVPGNAGLKDQVMALKWVRNNIRSFCGNPGNVTLFGQDAGAASVHLHVLSPMSGGLFRRAVMSSGCALNPWVNGVRGTGKLLGKAFNLETNDEEEILEFLRGLTVAELYVLGQEQIINPFRITEKFICSPVVETQPSGPVFLPHKPIDIIRSGNYNHVPMIFGYNNLEGMFFDIENILTKGRSELITDFSTLIPNNINCNSGTLYAENIAGMIKDFYYRFSRDDPHLGNKRPLFDMVTDTFFLRGIDRSVRNHLQTTDSPIYYYRFGFDGNLNLCKKSVEYHTKYLRYPGASHGDDLFYIFHTCCTPPIQPHSKEEICMMRMVKILTNFARYNEPIPCYDGYLTVPWRPLRKHCEITCMDIGDQMKIKYTPDFDRMKFWDVIYRNDINTKFL